LILVVCYILLKIRNRRLWVRLHPDFAHHVLGLGEVLKRLQRNAQTDIPGTAEEVELEEIEEPVADHDVNHA
jgi:hypothetical protein